MEYTLQQLKEIATKLNVEFSPNIGMTKLTERINESAEEMGTNLEEVAISLGYDIQNKESEIAELEKSITPISKSTLNQDEIQRLSELTFESVAASQTQKDEATQRKEALRLVRCIITCNNKNKTNYQGDIFCARNGSLPEIKKMIPFGVPTHIPNILLNVIREKKCQMYKKEKLSNGTTITKPYLIDEFNIKELPNLTREELDAIKKKQLAEGFTGE